MATLGSVSLTVLSERHSLRQDLDVFPSPGETSDKAIVTGYYGAVREIALSVLVKGSDENDLINKIQEIENLIDGGQTVYTYTNNYNVSYKVYVESFDYSYSVKDSGVYTVVGNITLVEGEEL